ncbi:hypothetical protein F5B20DRAFT_551368 [Whalleya microplaca]|nr:hypothetical protein F5B20DRAFT_551368 [Whalleya microplaca]
MRSLLALFTIAAAATADVKARSGIPEGYSVQPMLWRGVIKRGGPEMEFNGTLQEVERQIRSIEPDFTWEKRRRELGEDAAPISKRDDETPKIVCNVGGDPNQAGAYLESLKKSQDHLHVVKYCTVESTANDTSPATCIRVACDDNAGVWVCNDGKAKSVECNSVATYVQDIIEHCNNTQRVNNHEYTFVRGQAFSNTNYNVMVGYVDDCDAPQGN